MNKDYAHSMQDDLISRQDALNALYGSLNLDTGIAKIELLPSAEPKIKCIAQIRIDRDDIEDFINEKVNEIEVNMEEPKTGKWVKDALGMTVCSECRRWRRDNRTSHVNFCNSCGARMIGEEK